MPAPSKNDLIFKINVCGYGVIVNILYLWLQFIERHPRFLSDNMQDFPPLDKKCFWTHFDIQKIDGKVSDHVMKHVLEHPFHYKIGIRSGFMEYVPRFYSDPMVEKLLNCYTTSLGIH